MVQGFALVDTGDVVVEEGKITMGSHTLHNLMVDVYNLRTEQWAKRLKAE